MIRGVVRDVGVERKSGITGSSNGSASLIPGRDYPGEDL